jgi:hypothetical protein
MPLHANTGLLKSDSAFFGLLMFEMIFAWYCARADCGLQIAVLAGTDLESIQ